MYGLIEKGEYLKWVRRRERVPFASALRALVVGGGSAGGRHVANLLGLGVREVHIVEPIEAKRRELAERFGAVQTYENETDAHNSGRYDIAIIANPPIFHLESAMRAVNQGADVLVEKNISHSPEGVEEFLRVARQAGKTVAVNCIYRFFETLQYVRALLEKGAIGKVYSAQITFSETMLDWHAWEKPADFYSSQKSLGGSELYGENHTIDIARWLFGEIREVSAYVARLSDVTVDTDDFAELLSIHESGVVSQIHLDALGRQHRKDMWITGEKGTLCWDSYMGKNNVEWYDAESRRTEVYRGTKTRNDAFVDLLVDFLECTREKRQPIVDGSEALKTLQATRAAEESAKAKRRLEVVL